MTAVCGSICAQMAPAEIQLNAQVTLSIQDPDLTAFHDAQTSQPGKIRLVPHTPSNFAGHC